MRSSNGPLRIGIGGPVGSGKTTLTEKLCKALRGRFSIAVVTNDIYTKEDALMLARLQALPEERIMGVETGGCPHTAIREDASINLAAIAEMNRKFPDLDIVFIESGGDNLAATFSPDLADLTLYVISVCQGEEIPRKGGPGILSMSLAPTTALAQDFSSVPGHTPPKPQYRCRIARPASTSASSAATVLMTGIASNIAFHAASQRSPPSSMPSRDRQARTAPRAPRGPRRPAPARRASPSLRIVR